MERVLGVIGGYGSIASSAFTSLLTKKFFENSPDSFADADFPKYLLHNAPRDLVTLRGDALDADKILSEFSQIAEGFREFKVTDVVILCNTFHIMKIELKEIFKAFRFHSLPSFVSSVLDEQAIVFCSPRSAHHKLFGTDVQYYGNEIFIASSVMGKELEIPTIDLNGYSRLILGCTDLSWRLSDFEKRYPEIEVVDTLNEFAKYWIGVSNESLQ